MSDPSPLYENLLDPFALFPSSKWIACAFSRIARAATAQSSACAGSFPSDWSGWTSYSWSEANGRFRQHERAAHVGSEARADNGRGMDRPTLALSSELTWHIGLAPQSARDDARGQSSLSHAMRTIGRRICRSMPAPAGRGRCRRVSLDVFFEIDNLTNHNNPCCSTYRLSSSGVGAAHARRHELAAAAVSAWRHLAAAVKCYP